MTDIKVIAEGLRFPEGPVVERDGSILLVEIERQTLSRVRPDGRIEVVAKTGGGPNGLAIGPDGIVVQDSGIGIPPDDLARIFERRFRGAQSRGLGLGLYLVKRICERLGWSVRVSSAPQVGTRFEVTWARPD